MNKPLHSLIIAITCLFSTVSFASHMMGGDMSYRCLGSGKYKITAKIYRDCRGISFNNPTFLVYAGTNGGNGCGSSNMSISRTGIKDVTPRCSTASSPCTPQNTGGTGEGIEEHTYEVTVDFTKSPLSGFVNKSSCCEVTFAIGQCCRNGAITTGPAGADFFTTCMINICNIKSSLNKCNSSPQLSNPPIGFLCCNQAYYFNNGAIDTIDYDSFSYKLTNGINSLPNNSVSYSSPFDARYFMTPYCVPPTTIKCTPNFKTSPPRGLYFDTSSGDLIFTPTKCDEVGIAVIEITEWRQDSANKKWVVIGKTRRDMQLIVKDDCGYNKAPTITGPYNWKVCEGETIKFKVESDDETFSPYQTVPDTTALKWNKGIPAATFTIGPKSDWAQKRLCFATFQWTPSVGMASDVSYSFTVTVTDDHCPKPSQAIRGFKIKVNPRAFSVRKYKNLTCGRFAMSATVKESFKGIPTFRWSVRDSLGSNEIFYSTKKADTMIFYRGGKYIVVHTVNNSDNCPTIYRDTVIIPDPPQVIMADADTFACYGTTMTLKADVLFGKSPFKYYWTRVVKDTGTNTPWKSEYHIDGDTVQDLSIANINRDSTVRIRVTDGDGCIFYDTSTIYLKPLPILSIGPDQRICTYETATFDAQNADTVKYKWSTGDTTRVIIANVKGMYWVQAMETKWKCMQWDTAILYVNDTVVSLPGIDRVICNQKSTELSATHRPASQTGNYTWTDITGNKTLGINAKYTITPKNTNFPGGSAQLFYYELLTKVKQVGHECQHRDTVEIKVNTLPYVKWDPKPLKPQCYIYGDIDVNNFFNRGKDINTRIWSFENKSPNNVNTKPSTSTNPPAGSARNFIDSLTTGRHLFKTTYLSNSQLQNGNSFQAKIYAMYKDTNGCVNVDSVIQRINGNPMVDLSDSTFCQDLGSQKMDVITRRPKVKIGIKIDWSVLESPGGVDPTKILMNDNLFGGSPDWVFRFGSPTEDFYQGNYKFKLCVEDQVTGCLTCDTVKIKIIPEPTIKVTSPNPVCVNWDTMELYDFIKVNGIQANDGDGSNYEIIEYNYSRVDPKVKNTKLIKGHRFIPSSGTGTWYIRYGNAATGCLKQDSFYIYVNDTPNAVLLAPVTLCVSGPVLDLNKRIDVIQTKPAVATGVWTGTSTGVVITGSSGFKPFSQGSANNVEGPHVFRFTYTDNNGCSDTEVYRIRVRNQPVVTITTQKPASACEGRPFALQSSSKFSDSKVQWTLMKHADGSMSDGNYAGGSTTENVQYLHGPVDKIQKGAYLRVSTTPIVGDVCPAQSDSIEIVLHQYPDLTAIPMQVGCISLQTDWNVNDNRSIPSNQMAYNWSFGNGDSSSQQNPTGIIHRTQGSYTVRVIANNTFGNCKDTSTSIVEAYPIPVALFYTDPSKTTVALPKFKMYNQSTIEKNPFNPVLRYLWDFGVANVSDDTSTAKDPRYTYGKDTANYIITLITTSDKGCPDTAVKSIHIGPDIIVYIPNVFTPDDAGPNKNNTFNITAMNFRTFKLSVFNRWGEKLFTSNDMLKGWDGTANGAECQQDVYVFNLEITSLEDRVYKYSGTITLLR